MVGCFYGVGVGPGDPELITYKAARVIEQADVVAYLTEAEGSSRKPPLSRARLCASAFIPPQAEEIALPMPFCTSPSPGQQAYDLAAQKIAAQLLIEKNVAFLCLGDPLFYGSCIFLLERLRPSFKTEIIPGVSSVMACAALAQFPLARRTDVLMTLPATLPADSLKKHLHQADSAAILKIGVHWEKVCQVLTELDLLKHAHYVAEAGQETQGCMPLADLWPSVSAALLPFSAPYFSMILVCKGQK